MSDHDRRHVIRPQHPIVAVLIDALKDQGELSAKDATELSEIQELWDERKSKQKLISSTSYHLNSMESRGLVQVSRQVPVRGVKQTFYRLTAQGEDMPEDPLVLDRVAALLRSGRKPDRVLEEIRSLVERSGRRAS